MAVPAWVKQLNTIGARQKIEPVLRKWREAKTKPPFTEQQLVIMAILMLHGEATAEEIHEWVLDNFSFYRRQAAQDFAKLRRPNRFFAAQPPSSQASRFHINLTGVLSLFELPIAQHKIRGEDHYSISAVSGESLLAPYLPPPNPNDTSTFDFFGLPAELREAIYKMVFTYPKSGLSFRGHFNAPERAHLIGTVSRQWQDKFSWEDWDRASHPRITEIHGTDARPIGDILRPLLISKQFYDEAMPTFYRENHFHCIIPTNFIGLLRHMAPSRLKHVASISFEFDSVTHNFQTYLTQLSKMENLRHLNIMIRDDAYPVAQWEGPRSVMEVPDIRTLGSIRGLKSVTFPQSPTLQRELGPAMLRSKAEQQAIDAEEVAAAAEDMRQLRAEWREENRRRYKKAKAKRRQYWA